MSTSKLNRAIKIVEYQLKEKEDRITEFSRRTDLSVKQKLSLEDEKQFILSSRTLITALARGVDEALGKLPPQSIETEEAVLAAVLTFKGCMEKVAGYLLPEHFYQERNVEVYSACLNLAKNGTVVDMITVLKELRRTGKIESIGGAARLADLQAKAVNPESVEWHSRIVMEFAIKRRLIMLAGNIIHEGYDDTKDCFELLEESEEEFTIIKSWIK